MSLCNTLQLLLSFLVIVAPGVEQVKCLPLPSFLPCSSPTVHRWHSLPKWSPCNQWIQCKNCEYFLPLNDGSKLRVNGRKWIHFKITFCSSVWLLTLVCIQRFHSICHPSKPWKRRTQFIRHTKLCIIFCILLAIREFNIFKKIKFF